MKSKRNSLHVMLEPKVTVTFTLTVQAKLFDIQICRLPLKNTHIKDFASSSVLDTLCLTYKSGYTTEHNCENLILMSLFFYSVLF